MVNIIYIVDQKNGTFFNNRRQSSDLAIMKDVIDRVKKEEGVLYISDYSKKEYGSVLSGTDIPIKNLEELKNDENSFIFLEDKKYDFSKINNVVLIFYKWDKVYPSDNKINFDSFLNEFIVKESYDLKGMTHDKIHVEVWKKGE